MPKPLTPAKCLCGGKPLIDKYKYGNFHVTCSKCGHVVIGWPYEDAVERWDNKMKIGKKQ